MLGQKMFALAMFGTSFGLGVKSVLRTDQWAISRHLEGRDGRLARFVVRKFQNTPLRFVTLNRVGQQFDNDRLKVALQELRGKKARRLRQKSTPRCATSSARSTTCSTIRTSSTTG